MSGDLGRTLQHRGRAHLLAVVLPLSLVALILVADAWEGPKTAYVGVLTAMPFLAAVFGTPRETAFVGGVTWLAAWVFGFVASDGNVPAQQMRLLFIALAVGGAVLAARQRHLMLSELVVAEREHALVEQAQRDASTDVLTGLLNRRGIGERLESLQRRATWSVALGDCDGFKEVNDRLGHRAGDEYLQVLAVRLGRAIGPEDHIGRWGGDEFLLAMPLPPEQALGVVRRIQTQIARDPVDTTSGATELRLTFGLAAWAPGEPFDKALWEADRALYEGKRCGGDVTVSASGLID
ncbi:MAG: GGDEF domain-containing protein [Candidatus Nanopelagicales bacterium]